MVGVGSVVGSDSPRRVTSDIRATRQIRGSDHLAVGDDGQIREIAVSSASLAGAIWARMPLQEGDDLLGYVIINDPFLRRVLTDAGDRGHLGKTFAAKKPQHHRRAILVAQLTHRILQQRRELLPGFIRRNGMGLGLHIGLLFAADAAGFTPRELDAVSRAV